MSTADSAAPTTPAAVDGLSEEDLALAASAQASSDDWSAGPPPGRANAFWPSFTRMLALLAPFRIQLVMAGLASVVSVVLTVIAPKVLGLATNIVFEGAISSRLPAGATKEQAVESLIASGHGDMADMVRAMELVPGAGIDYSALGRVLLLALAVYIGSAVLSWLEGFILNRITIKAMLRLRADVEAKIHHLPLSYFDRVQRGELLSRVTNDVDNITNTLQQSLSGALRAILTVLGVVAMMLSISWKLTLAALVILPLMAVMFGVIGPRSQKAFTVQWAKTGRLNVRVEESFSGHALVRTYGRMRDARERFDAENEELYRAGLRAQFLSGLMMPIMQVIGNLAYVVIAVLGGFMVAGGSLRLGDVQAFIQYSQQFSQPLGELGGMATAVQSGTASAERVFELLDAEEERPDDVDGAGSASQAAPRPAHGGVIEMDRVRFSYDPDVELIRDLSLRVEPGQTVAIVGPTGAGKTTLVNLLMRFYDVDGGRITLDGVDISTMRRCDVRSRTGMVLQDPWLFQGTIRENIRYGRPGASDEEVEAAARACYVDHTVRALPEGYETVLEEEAANISAGERQLLTIARAFIADPAVLILDEATSSVDTRTELLVQRAMGALRRGRTSFVIAHRLSTIRDADTILVMERGDIVEQGSHAELLERGGTYARLHAAQFARALAENESAPDGS
ncbi:ABC transporter ATP-binding protein [Actinomyces massiliensis]|uniref:Fatty acid ABC transporter ATP-binding/permease protein n=1 Tax=Actinomyces massiliensis F0489 TaxID=1125718 RepID=J0WPG7_9ACTO|nr:ABC transporter ATP-binding protein [Actinomyces massiliensis]EJF38316.1 ABC transporter transmembrane region [Actinomyces massiliensis F0489]WLD70852.1 ABC transporter ATP-binding protein [Actinomyces massiliensis]